MEDDGLASYSSPLLFGPMTMGGPGPSCLESNHVKNDTRTLAYSHAGLRALRLIIFIRVLTR